MSEQVCFKCRSFFEGLAKDKLCKNCINQKDTQLKKENFIIGDKENTCRKCGSKFIGKQSLCSTCYSETELDKNATENIEAHKNYWEGVF